MSSSRSAASGCSFVAVDESGKTGRETTNRPDEVVSLDVLAESIDHGTMHDNIVSVGFSSAKKKSKMSASFAPMALLSKALPRRDVRPLAQPGDVIYGRASMAPPPPASEPRVSAPAAPAPLAAPAARMRRAAREAPSFARMGFSGRTQAKRMDDSIQYESLRSEEMTRRKNSVPDDALAAIVSLQSFNGSWGWSDNLLGVLGLEPAKIQEVASRLQIVDQIGTDLLATILVVVFLEKVLASRRDEWEMLTEKAVGWMNQQCGVPGTVEEISGRYLGQFGSLFATV